MKVLLLLFCLGLSQTFGQGLLPGLVTFQNSGNKPVPGALVKASLTHQQETAADGTFLLRIPGKKPGSEVKLRVEKAGYEVVNDQDLKTTLKIDQSSRLKLYLCPEGEWERNALAFYQINEEKITARYHQQVAEAKRALADQQARMADSLAVLKDQYDIVLAKAEELAQKFAISNLDDASEMYKQAFAFYAQGKIDSAIKVLKKEDILKSIQEAKAEIRSGQEIQNLGKQKEKAGQDALAQGIDNLILLAELLITNQDWAEVEWAYQKAVEADTSLFKSRFAYASFLQSRNRFQEAKIEFEKLLALQVTALQKVMTLNHLGLMDLILNEPQKSLAYFQEAFAIATNLTAQNPAFYQPALAKTVHNLSVAYWHLHQPEQALSSLRKALEIRKSLVHHDSPDQASELATSLHNLGLYLTELGNFKEGIHAYEESLAIRRALARQDLKGFQHEVAKSLHDLGLAYAEQNQLDSAVKCLTEGLAIRRALAEQNPEVYLTRVASTLNHLGIVYRKQKNYPQALPTLTEALEIQRALASQNPKVYLPEVAIALNNLGNTQINLQDFETGLASLKESLSIREMLAQRNPERFQYEVAQAHYNIGNNYAKIDQYEESLYHLKQSHLILHQFAKRNTERYGLDCVLPLMGLGYFSFFYKPKENVGMALRYLQSADSLLHLCPDSYRQEQYQAICTQVRQQIEQSEDPLSALRRKIAWADSVAEKARLQRELIEVIESSMSIDSLEVTAGDLAEAYGTLSRFLLFQQDFVGSEAAAYQGLALDGSQTWIYLHQISAQVFRGNFKQAKKSVRKWKDQPWINDSYATFGDALLGAFDSLESAGLTHPDLEKLRLLLRRP